MDVNILPFIEQNALYQTLCAKGFETTAWGPDDYLEWYPEELSAQIPGFVCPSEPTEKNGGEDLCFMNYRANIGDLCVLGDHCNSSYLRGMFFRDEWKSFAALTDGTSATLAFSERAIDYDESRLVKTTHVVVPSAFEWQYGYLLNPSLCLGSTNGTQYADGVEISSWRRGGRQIIDGLGAFCTFNTVFAPNSPSCADSQPEGYVWHEYYSGWITVLAPTSYHSGGVNSCMADGSVRFISDTIDTGDLTQGVTSVSGKSPYGVWGALGTRAGGETASL